MTEELKDITFAYIDPPGGWKYGFPKRIPKEEYEEIKHIGEWCVEQGYPEEEKLKYGEYFMIRVWYSKE